MPAHHDEEGVRGGQAASERGGGEDRQAGHEHAAAAEQVSGAAAEEQEAGEGQPVGGHHPLQVGLGETERAADGGQGDVHDREVHDRHEVGRDQQRERFPALTGPAGTLLVAGRLADGSPPLAVEAPSKRSSAPVLSMCNQR